MEFPAFTQLDFHPFFRDRNSSEPPGAKEHENGAFGFPWDLVWTPSESATCSKIPVATADGFVTRVLSALTSILLIDQFVLCQLWVPVQCGPAYVLTTSNQLFGLTEICEGLYSYRMASLEHRFYVNAANNVSIGLPGRVFLEKSPGWIPDMQKWSTDECPQHNGALHCHIQGSWAVPVIERDICLGVLEFVTTVRKDICDNDIDSICDALEEQNFESSKIKRCDVSMTSSKRIRKTWSSSFTYYDLARLFGLTKAKAAQELGKRLAAHSGASDDAKVVKDSTFRNICRNKNISWWPFIPGTTLGKARQQPVESVFEPRSEETPSTDSLSNGSCSQFSGFMTTENARQQPERVYAPGSYETLPATKRHKAETTLIEGTDEQEIMDSEACQDLQCYPSREISVGGSFLEFLESLKFGSNWEFQEHDIGVGKN